MSESDGGRLARTLARTRVPLGFVFAAAVLALATPTWRSLAMGGIVALFGESVRFWAAGHLEKGREVTRSGPYRWTRHPLYAGSALIGAGVAIAAARFGVSTLVAGYLAATIFAAIRHEEAGMRARFGNEYDAYARSRTQSVDRPFSFERAIKNKEHHAIVGLLVAAVVLSLKAALRSQ